MSFGMRIWGPTGSLELDENSFTVRVIYTELINSASYSGRSVTIQLPGVTPATCSAVCVPNGFYTGDDFGQDPRNAQYEPQVVNDAVIVWFGNRNFPTGPTALGAQRLYVMRYK